MTNRKLFIYEKILFLAILMITLYGFWYFEENYTLKLMAVVLSVIGIYAALRKKKQEQPTSKFELTSLLILYLGIFGLYNLLYSINLPLYAVMLAAFFLVIALVFSVLSLDEVFELLPKTIFQTLILLLGLVTLELFLTLYFWPIDPEAKSLIIVVFFYLITSLIYLYVHNMLRLKRIAGYVIVSLVVIALIIVTYWIKIIR